MKKIDYEKLFCPGGRIKKWLFLSKWITFFFFAGLLQVNASVYAQNEQVTFSSNQLTIEQVFTTITKQLKYDIFYSDDEINVAQLVEISDSQMEVEAVLKEILKDKFTYEFINKTIIIKPLQSSAQMRQNRMITGTVKDKKGVALAGVSVFIKGTNTGVATDAQGQFRIELPEREDLVLVFSFVGMDKKEVIYKGETSLEVVLTESYEEMKEVVVTGYQQIEKRQLTSAVTTVKTEDLNMIGASSIDQMLQGQVAGLSVVNMSAGPGATPKVRVRGTATIAGNADPLWVLDGVMLENSVPVSVADLNSPDIMNTFNSVIGGVNPNDIESITILKDASATAIYGTRAANGVIAVTTKKGKRNGFNISYQHTSAVSMRPSYRDFDLLNSQERVQLTRENYEDGLSISGTEGLEYLMSQYAIGNLTAGELQAKARVLESRNTDWFKILFRNAYTQTHNLSISGGSEKTDYYVSIGYNGEQGVDKISDYKSFSGLAKVNTELFRGVKFGATLQVGRRDRDSYHSSIDPFKYAIRTSRTVPLFDENGDYHYYQGSESGGMLFNILKEQENTHKETTQTDLKGIINLSVHLFKGLKYTGLYSYASSHSCDMDFATEKSTYVAQIRGYDYGNPIEDQEKTTSLPFGGVYNEKNYEQRTSLIRNGLEYKQYLTEDLSIDVLAGQEFRTTKYRGLLSQNYGYMHDRGNIFYDPSTGKETGHLARNKSVRSLLERSYISYYGVFSAMYRERYVVNANIRFDGSNLFGSNPRYRYLPLWSVSGKWILSRENMLADSDMVNNLALRASYGLRGNIVEESTPQIIASALPPNQFNSLLEMQIMQAPNPDLKWETTSSLNVGLEFAFFQNRLSGDIDYYLDNSRDLIAFKEISAVTGFPGKQVNYADVRNQGVDISLSGVIIRKKDLNWTMSLNLGYVHNKVTKSYITPQAQNLVKSLYVPGEVMKGKPVNGMFSYRFAQLNEEGLPGFYNAENQVVDSRATDIAEVFSDIHNLSYEGTRAPVISGGFNNVVRYKNLTFSALFAFGLKNKVRLPQMAYNAAIQSDQNANKTVLRRWRKPGDEGQTNIPGLNGGTSFFQSGDEMYYTTDMFNMSQMSVVPGDYLRLRNVTVEYRLPARWTSHVVLGDRQLGSVSVKFQAQNLFVVADKRLKGYDPETINYTSTSYGSLPLPRIFTLGLNVNF